MSRPVASWTAILLASATTILPLNACRTAKPAPAEPAAEPAPVVEQAPVAPAAAEQVHPGKDMTVVQNWFPTGDATTSVILLRQAFPTELRIDQDNEGSIEVANLTKTDLKGVSVVAVSADNIQFAGSTPEPMMQEGRPIWLIGDLSAGETRTIKVRTRAVSAGPVSSILAVNFANILPVAGEAVQPKLELAKSATPVACGTCSDIKLTYAVRNTGTGTARGVVVKDTLPAGISNVDGGQDVSLDAGDLVAGAERSFEVVAKVSGAGTFGSAASAADTTGLTATSELVATVVKEPYLDVQNETKAMVFAGRDATYRFRVTNPCECDIPGAAIRAGIPADTTYLSSSPEGAVSGDVITWDIGIIPPGKTMEFVLKVRPSGATIPPVKAMVTSSCVPETVAESTAVDVKTVAVSSLSVRDSDPVEVGSETSFVVEIANDGTGSDRNVVVVAELPESMEFVSGSGDTEVRADGRMITCAPLAELRNGSKATWTIKVKAVSAAKDARSKWRFTSEQYPEAVTREESTNLY